MLQQEAFDRRAAFANKKASSRKLDLAHEEEMKANRLISKVTTMALLEELEDKGVAIPDEAAQQKLSLLYNERLAAMMEDSTPAISRLGIPDYNYGYEALHGMINTCPFADRCFTSFPCSSAAAAAFRTAASSPTTSSARASKASPSSPAE